MTALPTLLDTDILSAIMRQDPVILPKAQEYLIAHDRFTFSIITRYEILRGLKAKGATKQVATLPGSLPILIEAQSLLAWSEGIQ